MNNDKNISKTLSYWLRHRPDAGSLTLDAAGWTPADAVLAALGRAGLPDDSETLMRVVAESDKNRFELSADTSMIRARQGHSVKVDLDWPITPPPEHLYHGTIDRFLDAILTEGLRPMKRHHVHLSPDVATATIVGARRGVPVILRIAAAEMATAGHVFRLSGNGVWLAAHVPPVFIART
ncbi:putative RNA 2'-phosphotransferase [Sphingomonas zeicaulis]|uniref:RNA 2'-phosphotransferase n=1 Tax=Sphingomonas zeicaulis TaxID=1632740 RepID=UPI003D234CE6